MVIIVQRQALQCMTYSASSSVVRRCLFVCIFVNSPSYRLLCRCTQPPSGHLYAVSNATCNRDGHQTCACTPNSKRILRTLRALDVFVATRCTYLYFEATSLCDRGAHARAMTKGRTRLCVQAAHDRGWQTIMINICIRLFDVAL